VTIELCIVAAALALPLLYAGAMLQRAIRRAFWRRSVRARAAARRAEAECDPTMRERPYDLPRKARGLMLPPPPRRPS
jgi:hypothetical protein